MKKFISILLITSFIFPFTVKANNLESPDITKGAKSAVMIDYQTGEVLYDKNANERRCVASLVKMMGLVIIMEKIDAKTLKEEEILTVSKNAKEMGGTQIWLEEGEKISVSDLLKGVTMASANDAMVLLAERVSGTEEAFVKEMNKKAKELNLKNTNFTNATGFDEENSYSSAYDMAIIAKELLKHKKILNYTSKYEDYIRENTENKTWIVNTNKLVRFYKGADGLKTGFTDKAGSTLAVTSKRDNLRLIAITLGYDNTNTRNNETMALLDYGYNQYESKVLLKKDKPVKTVNLNKAKDKKVNLMLEEDLVVVNKKGDSSNSYSYDIVLDDIEFPLKKGDKLGELILKNNGEKISEVPLVSDKNIEKAGIFSQYLRVIATLLSGSL